MRRPSTHLLRIFARHALLIAAMLALMSSVFKVPCIGESGLFSDECPVAVSKLLGSNAGHGSADQAKGHCNSCHGSALVCGDFSDHGVVFRIADGSREYARPVSHRIPVGPVATPDVPPDQI